MKQRTSPFVIFLLVCELLGACSPNALPPQAEALQGTVTVSGAFALYPLVTRWAEEFQRLHPGVRFDISSGGAGKGMRDVLEGQADIGMVSREITPEEMEQGAFPIAVAKDAVFPLINTGNPVVDELRARGLTREALAGIFLSGGTSTWGAAVGDPQNRDEIHVYTRTETCGAAETWSRYLGGSQNDLLGSGRFGDSGVLRALAGDPLGIGYSNQIYAFGPGDVPPAGTMILAIDANENGLADPEETLDTRQSATAAVASGAYPAPPARLLYLVTFGKPEGSTRAFLEWVLGDGQTHASELGYVPLPEMMLEETVEMLR